MTSPGSVGQNPPGGSRKPQPVEKSEEREWLGNKTCVTGGEAPKT